jgi:hypothetical protein
MGMKRWAYVQTAKRTANSLKLKMMSPLYTNTQLPPSVGGFFNIKEA